MLKQPRKKTAKTAAIGMRLSEDVKAMAEELADDAGMSLTQWYEQLVRREHAKLKRRQRAE